MRQPNFERTWSTVLNYKALLIHDTRRCDESWLQTALYRFNSQNIPDFYLLDTDGFEKIDLSIFETV